MKKILIMGDAGRGKTTFAEKLSEKLNIPKYSLDDFFWEVKFTKLRGAEKDVEMARECFEKDEWIVEGGTRRMLILGIPKADKIFYLTYKNIFQQIWVLYKRNRGRDNRPLSKVL
jgi:adenylate kinase family enzyme